MDQRRPRLGDVVDDYCPRERRLTNHAIVAMLDDAIKQTRCTTCDTEHEYKGARVPASRRKKEESGALYEQVLAAATDRPVVRRTEGDQEPAAGHAAAPQTAEPAAEQQAGKEPLAAADESGNLAQDDPRIRRSLIRATLPRTDAQPVARPIPEFTIRSATGRGGAHRQFDSRQSRGTANGNRAGHPHQAGRASGASFPKSGRPQQSHAHPNGPRKSSRRGKKRSR